MPTEPPDLVVEARELLAKATPGPWTQSALAVAYIVGPADTDFEVIASVGEYREDGILERRFKNCASNMSLITRAPELLRQLCDEVERLRSDLNNIYDCDKCELCEDH